MGAIVFLCLVILLAFMAFVLKVQNPWVPIAYLTGGFFSELSGFFGMKTATYASARTANAARKSLNSALTIAFRSGAVMGLVVLGLALLDICLWFLILKAFYPVQGNGVGMFSSWIPVLSIVVGTVFAFLFAAEFDIANLNEGLYGIGIAAVGMLSTLGITLATDAYGPIADNAGGNAQMSDLHPEVRKRTDAFDALGNTTAATGKGFAIGSAALTALALLASYIEELRVGMMRLGQNVLTFANGVTIPFEKATFVDFLNYFHVHLMSPIVIAGCLIGAIATGFVLGVFMANTGGVWDNAKKYIEEGNYGGKGSPAHKAAVVGDTVGDPFKDTAGPSLNILIKLMSMVCIVTSGLDLVYAFIR